jgi:hypothetical protein
MKNQTRKTSRPSKLKLHIEATESLNEFNDGDKADVREALFNIVEAFGSASSPVVVAYAGDTTEDPWCSSRVKHEQMSKHVSLLTLPAMNDDDESKSAA